MQQKSFEETLNEKVNEFHLQARPEMWQAIAQELKPAKKRVALAWWAWPIAVALVVGVGIYMSWPSQNVKLLSAPTTIIDQEKATKNLETSDKQVNLVDNHLGKNKADIVPAKVSALTNTKKASRLIFSPTKKTSALRPNLLNKMEVPLPSNIEVNHIPENDIANLNKAIENIPAVNSNEKEANLPIESNKEFEMAVNTNQIEPRDTAKKVGEIKPIANKIHQSGFYIGASLLPAFSKSLLTENPNFSISPSNRSSDYAYRKSTDKRLLLFGASLEMGWKKNRHQLYSGVAVQQLGYQQYVKNIERMVSTGFPVTTANTRLYATDSFQSASYTGSGEYFKNKFTYLNVPIGYQYRFFNSKKLSLAYNAELSCGLLLQSNTLLYDESTGYYVKQSAMPQNPVKKIDFFLRTGFELNYQWHSQWSLYVRPQLGTSVRPLQLGAVNTRYQFLQMAIGVQYLLH